MHALGSGGTCVMNDHLTTKQAAAVLDCTPDHVRRLCRGGRLVGAEYWGRDWRIPRAEVEHYQQERLARGRPKGARTERTP